MSNEERLIDVFRQEKSSRTVRTTNGQSPNCPISLPTQRFPQFDEDEDDAPLICSSVTFGNGRMLAPPEVGSPSTVDKVPTGTKLIIEKIELS